MLFAQSAFLLALSSAVATAAPVEKKWFTFNSWNAPGHSWDGRTTQPAACNMAAAQIPSSSLPPPSPGLALYHVAVGRGTQNYTCDLSNSTAVPVAVGAVANLFNVTCMSTDYPVLLDAIPKIAVAIPLPATADPSSPAYQALSGHHYFTDTTTPYFNLNTAVSQYGQGAFKKNASVPAPADAAPGSVAWLKLTTKNVDQCTFQEVYRVNTAGGSPPTTCTGQQAAFDVQYSAEYWFYG